MEVLEQVHHREETLSDDEADSLVLELIRKSLTEDILLLGIVDKLQNPLISCERIVKLNRVWSDAVVRLLVWIDLPVEPERLTFILLVEVGILCRDLVYQVLNSGRDVHFLDYLRAICQLYLDSDGMTHKERLDLQNSWSPVHEFQGLPNEPIS